MCGAGVLAIGLINFFIGDGGMIPSIYRVGVALDAKYENGKECRA